MVANYQGGDRANNECHSRRDGKKAPGCRGIATAALDDAVALVPPDALTPEQVALALAAASEVTGQHQRASRAAELAAEAGTRDQADRAERAFSEVEPENRLVARTLEARWEAEARRARRSRAGPGALLLDAAAAPGPGKPGKDRR